MEPRRSEVQTDSRPVLHRRLPSHLRLYSITPSHAAKAALKPLREDAEGVFTVSSCAEPPAVQSVIAGLGNFLRAFSRVCSSTTTSNAHLYSNMYERISVKTVECRSKQRWRPLERQHAVRYARSGARREKCSLEVRRMSLDIFSMCVSYRQHNI